MSIANDGQDRKDNIEDNLDACSLAMPFELCGNSAAVLLVILAHKTFYTFGGYFPCFVVLGKHLVIVVFLALN